MTDLSSIAAFLGQPAPADALDSYDELERKWGLRLPEDFKDLTLAYGDQSIAGYLTIFGPELYRDGHPESMRDSLEQSRYIPHPILPSDGGMLHWGHTPYSDQLFLVPRPDGRWTVSAWVLSHAEWIDYELTCVEWLRGALAEEVAAEWLPAWDGNFDLE
ncbi:SMI1/KNR4 family protein [Streptacidiphilus fuscans]|uniref:SMI1/KNR4 family protein n=1 Tax=Streptacidiphilus fuscans TaxID=2789292 RepID=A0A931FCC4_9ACTN|nr:SMI1/KNR4 family protein [Streptacidiphilus fuscans]MBF9068328.1 SMI1/KNR4 family protein [Streptacidiphilus fuscans]